MSINDSSEKEMEKKSEYGVILPCEPSDFGAFVSGLLGKPQTIEKSFNYTFEISEHDISNTFHLVEQRIHQQNEASLIQFTVKIIYGDDSSVLLNSLEDFSSYTEIRPLKSVGVHLSWVYLVKFRNKKVPEKQQIDLSIVADIEPYNIIEEDGILIQSRRRIFALHTPINLRINHTERTWGVDIESLLTGHIKTWIRPQNKTSKYIYKKSDVIGLSIGVLFFIGAIIGVIFAGINFINSYSEAASAIETSAVPSQNIVQLKIDFLVDIITQGIWHRFIFKAVLFIVFSLIVSIILGFWVTKKANNRPISFVLLSKAACEYRKKILSKRKRDWFLFVVSIFTSIIAGVISSLIFTKYFGSF